MKRRKIRYSDERSVSACIEQLEALVDGLKAGRIAFDHEEGPLSLAPAGRLNFELRVDQQRRKEVLRVELTWLSEAAEASATDTSATDSSTSEGTTRGPLSVPPAEAAANGSSNGNGHDETGGLAGLAAGEYRELFAAARTRGSDGRWHIDQDRLVQSLALAGVDALTQQELYALALQADADGSGTAFNDRVIEALEQASQHPPPPAPSAG
jgi:amphi-Trp domain-containing protein